MRHLGRISRTSFTHAPTGDPNKALGPALPCWLRPARESRQRGCWPLPGWPDADPCNDKTDNPLGEWCASGEEPEPSAFQAAPRDAAPAHPPARPGLPAAAARAATPPGANLPGKHRRVPRPQRSRREQGAGAARSLSAASSRAPVCASLCATFPCPRVAGGGPGGGAGGRGASQT